MENDSKHALVIPLFGELQRECMYRLNAWMHHGFWVVVVNNNPIGSSMRGVCANTIVYNHNHQGLAGGLNAGVTAAVADGARCITLLDQDSIISVESLRYLAKECGQDVVIGPRIVDKIRQTDHTQACASTRILISSGTTFKRRTWQKIGSFKGWMEIDYIDHEWCSRARSVGVNLKVSYRATLIQTFGKRHPNNFAHFIGLQLYSPYRRAIALRNLRWLILQGIVPLDIRLKELIKMLLKPWIWLLIEPDRKSCLTVIWLGITAPLNKPFPKGPLERLK